MNSVITMDKQSSDFIQPTAAAGDPNAVAVIGMAGRFPGAPDLATYWQNLCNGVEAITFFSTEELLAAGVDPALLEQPGYVKAGAILADIDCFDAGFFGIPPSEAAVMDPQQRFFLEVAYAALEDAGYATDQYPGAIGVYAGATISNYFLNNLHPNPAAVANVGAFQAMLSNGRDYLPTLVSYKLNLRGPSLNIQTACSTSLTAVHLACQSLQSGECDLALAGGASIFVPHKSGYLYEEGMILSPDGHCRAFDAAAAGTMGGNGVGAVVLKRLDEALADGDHIYAVIRGSAVNNDGAAKVGYTAPGVRGQAAVITEALSVAGIDAATIRYVETHGTGTPLGDPIEIAALTQAFRTATDATGFCAIGSVKTNIGHADAAAGIAGLIKTVLMLHHRQLPPSLNFNQPNPQIDFAGSPFFVNTALRPWCNGDDEAVAPRRAGVSSFGIGGTNVHVILEEAPPLPPVAPGRPYQPLVLSAKSASALDAATVNLADHLAANPTLPLADVAYTLATGRNRFDHRRLLVAQSSAAAATWLHQRDPQRLLTNACTPPPRPFAFLFSGQGSQYVNMGRGLYATEPLFRQTVDECAALLQPQLGLDLRRLLYPPPGGEGAATAQLAQTALAQPALFVIEYALAHLWRTWLGEPAAMLGHSLGEYVAATLAGLFSLADALALVAERGQLMQSLPPGAMLSVARGAEEVQSWLTADVALAASNGPALAVLSGPVAAIDEAARQLAAQGVEHRRLHTAHAFHSPMMEPILASFTAAVQRRLPHTSGNAPALPYLSNLSGDWIQPTEATDPTYWARHLRSPVLFDAGLRKLLAQPELALIEVGPGHTLSSLTRQHPARQPQQICVQSLRHAQSEEADEALLMQTVGKLWLAGVTVDWAAFYQSEERQRLPLPTYPFARQRYWIDPPVATQPNALAQPPRRPVTAPPVTKKAVIDDWFYLPSWKRTLPPRLSPGASDNTGWLIFTDGSPLASALYEQLAKCSPHVITVTAGAAFAQTGATAYTINPCCRHDYDALLHTLATQEQPPGQFLHLWSMSASPAAASPAAPTDNEAAFEQVQTFGLYSLLLLAQALQNQRGKAPKTADAYDLIVLTNGLYAVTGDEDLVPAKATLTGALRVFPQEYQNLRCRTIDIARPSAGVGDSCQLATTLLADITATAPAVTRDKVVAYRGRHRWVQHFEPVQLPPIAPDALPLRPQGTYLITGGLGEIGRLVAAYLAEQVQANLVLVSRRGLPPRPAWPAWLATHEPTDPISRQVQSVQTLEKLGAQVLLLQADVCNQTEMAAALAAAEAHFGPIHGLFHAAGIAGDRAFQAVSETTPAVCAAHFQAKVKGLLVLEQLLAGQALDFALLFSSLAAQLGGLGFAAYAAANAFMDAFAQERRRHDGLPWLSVNWDGWAFDEKEGGRRGLGAAMAALAIQPAEGLAALQRLLGQVQTPQLLVSTGDLQARLDQWVHLDRAAAPEPARPALQSTNDAQPQPRPAGLGAYLAPRNDIEQTLCTIYQTLLGLDAIGVYDDFFELGGHSLLGAQLLSRLRDTFAVGVSLQTIFERPTVAALAEQVGALRLAAQANGNHPSAAIDYEEGEL